MDAFQEHPKLAGICGFYRSASNSDWNLLRDIKRHSIYGKSKRARRITIDNFTTFSTGIGIVRKSVFLPLSFPEKEFPPDFGGEDTPALITALNQGYEFAYIPELRGLHEHNLTMTDFLKKVEIEVRGRYSLFYWATNNPNLIVPYLHGFLSFPLLFYVSICVAAAFAPMWHSWGLLLPGILLAYECLLSSRCLITSVPYRLRDRMLAACYVLVSDLVTPLCGLQYLLSSYKRPYNHLGGRRFLRMLRLFLKWEMTKLGIYRPRLRSKFRVSGNAPMKRPVLTGSTQKVYPLLTGEATPSRLKVSLLSHGVDFPLNAFAAMGRSFYENRYVYGRTSRGVLRQHRLPQALKLRDGVIFALLRREGSPWEIQVNGECVSLLRTGEEVTELELPERPVYFGKTLSNGQRAEDFIAVAGESIPGFFLYPECHYFAAGLPCGFCSLSHTRKTAGKDMANIFPLELIAEATRLFQRTPWKDSPIISISTGTFSDNDEGAKFVARVIKTMEEVLEPKIPIHLLTMPPTSLELIDLYRESGVTSIAFNLEVFDRDRFIEICPGKHKYYGYDKYLQALREAVKVFGAYNVFCGFVWGMESKESLLSGYRWCFDRGISVSSNVFHADQGSAFANYAHPAESDILSLCKAQSMLYMQYSEARPLFTVSMRSTLDWEIYRGDFR